MVSLWSCRLWCAADTQFCGNISWCVCISSFGLSIFWISLSRQLPLGQVGGPGTIPEQLIFPKYIWKKVKADMLEFPERSQNVPRTANFVGQCRKMERFWNYFYLLAFLRLWGETRLFCPLHTEVACFMWLQTWTLPLGRRNRNGTKEVGSGSRIRLAT